MLNPARIASTVAATVAAALALAACPEEPEPEDEPNPLEGIYVVTEHSEAEPCDAAPVAPAFPITRFKLAEDKFFLATILGFFDCSETLDPAQEELDDDGCSTAALLGFSGYGDTNEVELSSCSCVDDTCTVSDLDGNWEETDDGAALVLDRLAGDVPNPGGEDCDPTALVEDNRDDLVCETRTTMTGTRE